MIEELNTQFQEKVTLQPPPSLEKEHSIDQEWTSLLGWKAVTMSPPWSSVLPTFPHTPGASDVRPRVNVERSGGKRARSSRDPHRRQDKPCGGPRRPAARPGSRRARRGGPPVGDTPKGRRRPSGVRVPTVISSWQPFSRKGGSRLVGFAAAGRLEFP